MNRPVPITVSLLCSVLAFAVGCAPAPETPPIPSGSEAAVVEPGDTGSLVLFRLDGDRVAYGGVHEGETLHGWSILQNCPITDQHASEGIKDAMVTALEHPPELEVDCFMPRHAIRIPDGDDFIDWLICFQCGNYRSYEGESLEDSGNIGDSLKPVLDRYLSQCN